MPLNGVSGGADGARERIGKIHEEGSMSTKDDALIEIARAICRVQICGGDPNQPAARWNGTELELQDFPVWKDFMDEARAAHAVARKAILEEVANVVDDAYRDACRRDPLSPTEIGARLRSLTIQEQNK